MKDNWLWDRKITEAEAKRILKKPDTRNFFDVAALLLSRKNEPRQVLKGYIDPIIFCKNWPAIKRKMRQDRWSEPRIIFWQAIYEKLVDKYRKKGIVFSREAPAKKPFCAAVGEELAGVRRKEGWSQKNLARKVGVSQQLISRIESGGENVSLGTLVNIAHAMNKKVEINFVG